LDGRAQVLDPPEEGSPSEASWQWRYLPVNNVERSGRKGCVLSDGRFAVFGGCNASFEDKRSSGEMLTLGGESERWESLPPMHEARVGFACAAIGGCVVVAGGIDTITAEVYEEALGRWRRLLCNLPNDTELCCMGSATM
jgi:hypothetical protein